jgi:aromatic-L-amino-acid/L-tryptophan decarboxylase
VIGGRYVLRACIVNFHTSHDDIGLSRTMADAVARDPELELFTQSLSIATFRFVPADLRPSTGDARTDEYLNRLNQALLDALQRGGEAFVSHAVIGGRYVLRACIVNFHTSHDDVEALPGIVVRAGRGLDAQMRSL